MFPDVPLDTGLDRPGKIDQERLEDFFTIARLQPLEPVKIGLPIVLQPGEEEHAGEPPHFPTRPRRGREVGNEPPEEGALFRRKPVGLRADIFLLFPGEFPEFSKIIPKTVPFPFRKPFYFPHDIEQTRPLGRIHPADPLQPLRVDGDLLRAAGNAQDGDGEEGKEEAAHYFSSPVWKKICAPSAPDFSIRTSRASTTS